MVPSVLEEGQLSIGTGTFCYPGALVMPAGCQKIIYVLGQRGTKWNEAFLTAIFHFSVTLFTSGQCLTYIPSPTSVNHR